MIYIQDLGDNTIVPSKEGSGRWLIISSPNAEKLHRFAKNPRFDEEIIIPSWTFDELSQLERHSSLNENIIKQRFERMGGIPRWITEAKAGKSEERQNKQINGLNYDTLRGIMI